MSTATLDTKTSEHAADAPVLLAVSYLRVSTREQAERGGTEEGFSIPAQREANARKAAELGARVVREFVDAGESARSADRDGLQDMLAFIAATRVTFCIVHKLDRLARNRADDVKIHEALINAGVTLVSATEVHRPDAVGDARPRHHVVHRGVLQPEPCHRGHQGPVAEGRAGRHPDAGTGRLPQRPPDRRTRPRSTHSQGRSRTRPVDRVGVRDLRQGRDLGHRATA